LLIIKGDQLRLEISNKRNEIENGKEFKETTEEMLKKSERKGLLKKELNTIYKPIFQKYFSRIGSFYGEFSFRFDEKNIKDCVRRGIKSGLGITNLKFISGGDYITIIKKLIANDLSLVGNRVNDINSETEKLEKEIGGIISKRDKLYDTGLGNLRGEHERINDKLWFNPAEQKIIEQRKINKGKIKNLDKYIDQVKKSVEKEMILDKLKNAK